MNRSAINICYAQSLLWVAFFIALASGLSIIVELIFVDFIHGNPHRTQANALQMMFLFPPLTGIIAVIGSFIVFTIPQCFQAIITVVLAPKFGRLAQAGVFIALPLTTAITWYCFDYLTPSNVGLAINDGPDWTPYEHGLTLPRYLMTLAVQAPVTVFSLLHCDAAIRRRAKKRVILAALVLAIVVGGIWGYRMAENQFQFLL